tara:strand:+ start:162 stop:707 length:546 start_codon:yes stop_codon:yes gene_type:complete
MKKIRISESELIDLIEKLVKENIGGNTGFDFGMLGTPTSKYKDLYEDEDVESEEELDEDEFNLDTAQTGDKTLTLNKMKQTNMSDWMGEGKITESQLVRRLSRKLHEADTIPDITPDVKIPKGLFTKKASEIVAGLKNLKDGVKEALTRITYYINRGGKNLPNKTEVLKAKKILKKEKEDK